MQPRILVVEDEPAISELIAWNLEQAGQVPVLAESAEQALERIQEELPDLVLLDWMLPGQSGLELARRLRGDARTKRLPIIMLTARGDEEDKLRGLETGADDYLTKPFALPELEARVRALTRRGTGQARCIEFARLSYDQADRVVKIDGQVVDLSAREIGLLEVLLLRAGRLVSKEQLVDHLCGWGEEVSNNAIEVYVHRLRKKLEHSGVQIVTVRGLGYCLEKPDVVA